MYLEEICSLRRWLWRVADQTRHQSGIIWSFVAKLVYTYRGHVLGDGEVSRACEWRRWGYTSRTMRFWSTELTLRTRKSTVTNVACPATNSKKSHQQPRTGWKPWKENNKCKAGRRQKSPEFWFFEVRGPRVRLVFFGVAPKTKIIGLCLGTLTLQARNLSWRLLCNIAFGRSTKKMHCMELKKNKSAMQKTQDSIFDIMTLRHLYLRRRQAWSSCCSATGWADAPPGYSPPSSCFLSPWKEEKHDWNARKQTDKFIWIIRVLWP